MMPGLDGFGLLAALRSDPATSQLPVIMLSARAGEEAAVEGLAAGADDYLVKPFSSRELIARVRANLDLADMRQAAARATERHAQLLRDLADAAVEINRAATVPAVLEVVAQRASALVGADRAVARLEGAAPGARRGGLRAPRAAHGLGRAAARGAAARRGVGHGRRRGGGRPHPARPGRRDALGERAALRARAPRRGDAAAQPAARVRPPVRPRGAGRAVPARLQRGQVGGDWYDAIVLDEDDDRARDRRRGRARRARRRGDGPAAQRGPRVPARGLRAGPDARARQPPARDARRRVRDARLPVRRHRDRRGCATPTPATRRR